MKRRLPTALPAVLTAAAGLFVLTLVAPAQPPKEAPPPADVPKSSGDLRKPQEQNAKLFRDLAQGLLRLAQKLERSDKPEDQERAKTIRAALKVAEEAGVENQFQKLIAVMSKGTDRVGDLQTMIGQDAELAKTLQEIVNILMTDDETARIKAEIAKLTAFLKEVKDIRRREEIIRAMTEAQKGDASKIAKTQAELAKQTADLAKRMGGQAKDGGDKADAKSEPKGEGKPGDKNAESKDDAKGAKSTGKGGEPKDAANEPKPGEPKAGDQESEPREGSPEKAGAEARGQGEPKAGEPKSGDPKAGEPKSGDPKGGDPKAGDPKSGDPKAGDPKSQNQPNAQADPKGKGEGKAESKPTPGGQQSQARGMGGDPKNQQQQAQNKGGQQGGQPGGDQQQQQQQQQANKQNQTPGRKQVEEAYPHEKRAEGDLNKQDRKNASKNETKAIEELSKAIEELEKRLKQLREEEMLKTLAALEARCNRMLSMQIEVYENTKAIHASILKTADKKPEKADIQKSQQQASKEQEIVVEADKALKLLESEGSAVAFATVLEEVKGDMQAVQRRLEATYVGPDTQAIEEAIIAMLKDMIQALKKAQQDLQNQQQNPQQNNSNRQNQRLIDLLAELRLIRAMQVQVNQRTVLHGKKYDGEQASDAIIQAELRQLSQRQVKLQDMIHKIATQANQ
jgi:hypothetical protein